MERIDTSEPDLFGAMTLPRAETPRTAAHKTGAGSLVSAMHATTVHDDEDHDKAGHAFKTISETAKMLSLPQHVLRFWESKFTQIKPLKLKGGRRYYRPEDIETLFTIKHLLYKQGYTIKGARKAFTQARKQKEEIMAKESTGGGRQKRKSSSPRVEDTPLFSMLGGSSPQSALLAMASANPREEFTLSATSAAKPVVAPKSATSAVKKPEPIAAAPAPAKVAESAPAGEDMQRKDELKQIHSELLELRKLIGELPPLTVA